MFTSTDSSTDRWGRADVQLNEVLANAQRVAQMHSLPAVIPLTVLYATVNRMWARDSFDAALQPQLSYIVNERRERLLGGVEAQLIALASNQSYLPSGSEATYPPGSPSHAALYWPETGENQSALDYAPTLKRAFEAIQSARPSVVISVASMVWGLLKTDAGDTGVRAAFMAVVENPHLGMQCIEAVQHELEQLIAAETGSGLEITYRPDPVPALSQSPRSAHHVALRNEVLAGLTHSQQLPVVVSGYNGSPKDAIPGVLADTLALPVAQTLPLRQGQPVFLISVIDLLQFMEIDPDKHHLQQAVKYVAGKRGLLILDDLEELAHESSDLPVVRERKTRLILELKGMRQAPDPEIRATPIVALYEDADDLLEGKRGIEGVLSLKHRQDMHLIPIDFYSLKRVIGCVRDYFLVHWYDDDKVTFPGITDEAINELRAEPANRDELRGRVDPYLRRVFAYLTVLQHGACERGSLKPIRAPYLFIEVVERLIEWLTQSSQNPNSNPEREMRALAFQAATHVARSLERLPTNILPDVSALYRPCLERVQERLLKMFNQAHERPILQRKKDHSLLVTGDMLAAMFLGTGDWTFEWPHSLPTDEFLAETQAFIQPGNET